MSAASFDAQRLFALMHHEDPLIDLRRAEPLEVGMVLSLELEFLHADAGHVKIEDLAAITDTSPEGRGWQLSSA